MLDYFKLNLQLFAEGGEGGDGATTGDTPDDAGQARLLELGVPKDKIRKRAKKAAPVKEEQPVQQAAAAEETPTEDVETKETTNAKPTWDELMADPDYNRQMQTIIQSRLKSSKAAEENLTKITPAIEMLARKYGLDMANVDYDALAEAINNDDSFYEDEAIAQGKTVDVLRKEDQKQREDARKAVAEQKTLEQEAVAKHIKKLEEQGEALKATFPKFDLRTELGNETFARLVSPGVGLSVEDAYHAVHRKEIQAASSQVIAQRTAQQISNSIQAGQRRPDEAGISAQAPSVTTFNYKTASREQRQELKDRIRRAAAKGEKIYPGR